MTTITPELQAHIDALEVDTQKCADVDATLNEQIRVLQEKISLNAIAWSCVRGKLSGIQKALELSGSHAVETVAVAQMPAPSVEKRNNGATRPRNANGHDDALHTKSGRRRIDVAIRNLVNDSDQPLSDKEILTQLNAQGETKVVKRSVEANTTKLAEEGSIVKVNGKWSAPGRAAARNPDWSRTDDDEHSLAAQHDEAIATNIY